MSAARIAYGSMLDGVVKRAGNPSRMGRMEIEGKEEKGKERKGLGYY